MGGKRTIDYDRVASLAAKGLTAPQIAARLGCSARQVGRILSSVKKEDK